MPVVQSIESPGRETSDARLSRSLSFWELFFLIVSASVGSGWLFASLGADSAAGPAAVISWLVAGALSVVIALTYAEVAGMLPRSGAIVRYPHYTHGSFAGTILGWAYLLWALAIPALEAEAVVTYASSYVKGLVAVKSGTQVLTWPKGIGMAVGLMLLFFLINYYGVRWLCRANSLITLWKLLIPILTFLFLFFFSFHSSNYAAFGGFAPFGAGPIFSAIVSSGITFSVLGFRQAVEFGGEARNPQRDLPLATILGLMTAILVYIGLQAAFTGSLDWSKLGVTPGHWSSLQKSAWAAAPFSKALKASGVGLLGGFSSFLLADAYISPGATGFVYLGTGTRTLYGLSTNGYLPRVFQRLTRTRIPVVALAAAAVVGCLLFAPFPSWYSAVGLVSSAAVLTYVMGGIGLMVLRRTAKDLPRSYRLGGAAILAPLATMAAAMIVYWSGFLTLVNVDAAVFLVLPAWTWNYAPQRGWIDRRVGTVIGLVFLGAWIFTMKWSGWVLTSSKTPLRDHPSFPVLFAVMAIEVVAFTVVTWVAARPAGRREIVRSVWLEFLILASLLLAYYGSYGPLPKPAVPFPDDSLIALGIGLVTYGWAVVSGFATEDIEEIVKSGSGVVPEEPVAKVRAA